MRSNNGIARLVTGLSVSVALLAMAVGVSWAQSPSPEPSEDEAAAADNIPVVVPVPESVQRALSPGSAGARATAQQAIERLTADRRAVGQLSIEEQLERGHSDGTMPAELGLEQAYAVVTFDMPMPISTYRDFAAGSFRGLSADARATLYLELSDGYPLSVSGPVSADLSGNLRAFMSNTADRIAAGSATLSSLGADDGGAFAARLRAAVQDLDGAAVVLGVTLPLVEYQDQSSVFEPLGVAAVELAPTPQMQPFLNTPGQLDVASARNYYNAVATRGD